QTESFGKVACNGLVYINNGEALIMDTPTDDSGTHDLLQWLKTTYPGTEVKGVVINHFHDDCLGGLEAFHQAGIPSYSYKLTKELAIADSVTVPQHTFSKKLNLTVGGAKVISRYFGPAHSRDNSVTYIPAEELLFGGCMVKAQGAGKGNLADADVQQWPQTVAAIKKTYPGLVTVVPGHGEASDAGLLDYTIKLFR